MLKKILTFGLISLLLLGNFSFAIAVDPPASAKDSTPRVVQPPIIPPGANTKDAQIAIPTAENAGNALQEQILPSIASLVIGITSSLSLLFVIFGGLQMITAQGEEEKFKKGKKTITFALIGLLLSLLSYGIVAIISALPNNIK